MARKRVIDIAKERGLVPKDLVAQLQSAGISVKAAASTVEETTVDEILKAAEKPKEKPAAAAKPAAGKKPAAKSGRNNRRRPPADVGTQRQGARGTYTERADGSRVYGSRTGAAPVPKASERPTAEPDANAKKDAKGGAQGSAAAAGGRRRVVIDAQAARRGPGGPGGGPGGPGGPKRGGKKSASRRRKEFEEAQEQLKDAPTSDLIEEKKDLVKINSGATVKDVAEYLDVPVPELIKKLMELGEMATLTQTLADEVIVVLASEFDRDVEMVRSDEDEAKLSFDDSEDDLKVRPPVVTIMGHVDHGKTSLLDAIRETEVVAGEAGGITQHIGAYQVHHNDKAITFIDTPGHEAFTAMRARGAKVTDIAVIVVAADDGVKPQTEEAIDHAKAAGVPILVAVNKVDKPDAQPDQARTQMAQHGLQPEEWGGSTIFVDVSAKKKTGLDNLLDMLLLMAELEEVKANPEADASGIVIESKLDQGRGPVVTVLIQRGTLRVGDDLVAGSHWGRVRAMHNDHGKKAECAEPGDPIEILGFDGVPEAGEFVRVVENDRVARQMAQDRITRLKTEALARRASKRVSLEDVFALAMEGKVKDLNLVLKADVSGSIEAFEDEIAKLPQDEVAVNVIHKGVGGINESDVMLAAASKAIILGFNVRPIQDATQIAEREGVEIRSYSVIYKAIEDLRAAMTGMLEPEEVEETVGELEVREIFRASKIGVIAGSYVTSGKINRGAKIRVVRDGTVVYDGEVATLKRFKEDAKEVLTGFECGVVVKDFMDVKAGDNFEVYETKQVKRQLA